jgi:hypothetical protein
MGGDERRQEEMREDKETWGEERRERREDNTTWCWGLEKNEIVGIKKKKKRREKNQAMVLRQDKHFAAKR